MSMQVDGIEFEYAECSLAVDGSCALIHGIRYVPEDVAQSGTELWVVFDYDMGVKVNAVFLTEIDALRYAQASGYHQYVRRIEPGEIGDPG